MNILLIIIPFLIGLYLSKLGLMALCDHRNNRNTNKTLKLSTPRGVLQGTKDEQ